MKTRVQRIANSAAVVAPRTPWVARFLTFACAASLTLSVAKSAEQPAPNADQIAAEVRTQRQFATNAYLADLHRAQKIHYALIKAGAPYCVQRRKYSLGIPPLAPSDLPQELRAGYADTLQSSGNSFVFLNVAWDSPESEAGIQRGDVLVQMVDTSTGKAIQPDWTIDRPSNTLVTNELVQIQVRRQGSIKSLGGLPQLVCDMRLQLLRSNSLIVKVDSGIVSLSQGLLRLLPNDDELAYLLANEIIHEQLSFGRSPTQKPTEKEAARLREEDEREADYLGAYLIASAQYDVIRGQEVWRRIASLPPDEDKGNLVAQHPLLPMRGVQIQSVSNEIRRKTMTGARQIPERHFSLAIAETEIRDTVKQESRSSERSAAHEDPRLRTLTNIPFLDNEGIAGYQRFLASPLRPRAFAIGPTSRGAWSFKFGTNAAADALAHCATFARRPCFLYAVDDTVVWNPETAGAQPQINSSPTPAEQTGQPKGSGFAAISDLKSVPLEAEELPKYQAFLEKPVPRAFLITQDGKGFYWLGAAATHDALAHCARLGTPCWLYAVNNEVVWSKDISKRISRSSQLPSGNAEAGFLEN